jgi:hypothetical protein
MYEGGFSGKLHNILDSQPTKKSTKKKKNKKVKETEEDKKARAELELITVKEQQDQKKGYNLPKMLKESKKKGKKRKAAPKDDFQLDNSDTRFDAVFENQDFAIDPIDKRYPATNYCINSISFKDTPISRQILHERVKKSAKQREKEEKQFVEHKKPDEMQNLVQSVS